MRRLLAHSILLAVVIAAPAPAAPRRVYRLRLEHRQTWLWAETIRCRKGHPVAIIGTGCTPKYQLSVFDRNNRFIATDLSQKKRQEVGWVPQYTGPYTVCLVPYYDASRKRKK